MNNWVMGFDGFIGALTGDEDVVRNIKHKTEEEDYTEIEVEDGLSVFMRRVDDANEY